MKIEELFEMYKNLDMKERLKFDRKCIKFNEEEKLKQLSKRKKTIQDLNNVIDEQGNSYISTEWINQNILVLKK